MEVTRRDALRLGLGAVATGVLAACAPSPPPSAPSPSTTMPPGHDHHPPPPPAGGSRSTAAGGRWSTQTTWVGGVVPASGAAVVIAGPVVLDADPRVSQLDIEPNASLTFDPGASRTLVSSGNVVNRGLLTMRPARHDVLHQVTFVDIDEANFVGGGMSPLPTDVGLWVVDAGSLDLAGQPKAAWLRAAGGLTAGQRSLGVDADPTGWQVGDELVVTPTTPVDNERETGTEHEVVTITGVSGRTITLAAPLRVAHPATSAGPRGTLAAEVLNLTRNVRIEGTPDGRTHVFVHATRPQLVEHTALRHLAPQQPDQERDGGRRDVLGRYGLHLHHCGDGSRGSRFEGVVARDLGGHAFVPHVSNGTTWIDCIAQDTTDFAYWWDPGDASADTVFDRCVASAVGANTPNAYVNAGFLLGAGPERSNAVRNCVASGISGDGFLWYDGDAVWQFSDVISHNNVGSGVRVWQNNSLPHLVSRFTCYGNGEFGIDHGAYANSYHYDDGVLVDNASGPVGVRTVSVAGDGGGGLRFSRLYCDASGRDFAIQLPDAGPVRATRPTVVEDCDLRNYRKSGVGWYVRDESGSGEAPWADISGCRFDGNELWLPSRLGAGSRISFASSARGRLTVRPAGQPGTPVPAWNASVQPA